MPAGNLATTDIDLKIPARSGVKAGRRNFRHSVMCLVTLAWAAGQCLTACLPVTRPVFKIGLVAPFEGRYRAVGYEVIYAVRLAVREANTAGGVAGYAVELMALDDAGETEMAIEQAHKLETDPQIVGVLGHWRETTTQAAAPVYANTGIPLLATAAGSLPEGAFRLWLTEDGYAAAHPDARHCPLPCESLEDLFWLTDNRQTPGTIIGPPLWSQSQFLRLAGPAAEGVFFVVPAPLPADSADPLFADRYRAIANGIEPYAYAVLAYDGARLLLSAAANAIHAAGKPSRAGVAAALGRLDYAGLSGRISFDADGDSAVGQGWLYRWANGQIVKP